MFYVDPCPETGLPRVVFGKEIYINTESKIIRLKAAMVWIKDGKEFRRVEKSVVISGNDIVRYIETGETDADGNPIMQPVDGYTDWYEQPIEAGKIGDALKTIIDGYLQEHLNEIFKEV